MKARILVLCSMLLISGVLLSQIPLKTNENLQSRRVVVYCPEDLMHLTSTWAAEFMKQENLVQVEVKELKAGLLALPAGALMVSSAKPNEQATGKLNWRMAVGRDIIVPVVNANNPNLDDLRLKGVTAERLLAITQEVGSRKWDFLAENGNGKPIKFYLSNEASVVEGFGNLIGIDANTIENVAFISKTELISNVQKDLYSLGFCRLGDIVDAENLQLAENLALLPIDINQNGTLDYFENIYSSLSDFLRGVWIGKYPKSLFNDIYIGAGEQPAGISEKVFLNWVLTSGQQYLSLDGFSDLSYSERQSKLDKINNIVLNTPLVARVNSTPKLVFLVSLAILFLGLILASFLRFGRKRSDESPLKPRGGNEVFDENSISVPKGLYFDKTHTWAFMEKDGMVRIGIDDFLQNVTGRITRVDLKKPGEKVKRGDKLLSIAHKGKHLNIYSPVTGVIKEYNKSLASNAGLINESPYTEGWIYMVEPFNWAQETRILSMADHYVKWIMDEFTRLKDFFAANLNSNRLKYSSIVLQDGGSLKQNILEELNPAIWEDFQTDFLDPNK